MENKALRQNIEVLLQDYYRARYLKDIGGRWEYEPQEIISRFTLEPSRNWLGEQGDGNSSYLWGFVALLELEKQVQIPLHPINDETSSTIDELYRLVAVEPDRAKRTQLLDQAQLSSSQLDNLILKSWVQKSGFESFKVLFQKGLGAEIENLPQSVFRLLKGTDQIYRFRLQQALAAMSLAIGKGHLADLVHYFRGNIYDEFFLEIELVPTLEDTLYKMGINLHKMDNLSVVTRPADSTAKRVACHPVLCPQEVYLVARPRGGYRDYQEILHQAGHALHYAYTEGVLPVEYRRLGDFSVGEAYALLLANITQEAGWVDEFFDVEPLEEYLALVGFERLFNLRLDACRALRLLKLLDISVEEWDVTQVMGVELPDSLLRLTPPQDFYAIRRIRSRMLAAQIRAHLVKSVGHAWYMNSQSGQIMQDLWRKGTSMDSEKLTQALGFAGLSPDSLLAELNSPTSLT